MIDMMLNSEVLASMIRIATPLTLAALGCLMCQRAGIFNIAIEGFMLFGAFFGIVGVMFTGGNVWIGMALSMVAGTILAALFGLVIIRFHANMIISGIAINLLSLGLTSYLLRAVFDVQGSIRALNIEKLSPVNIPFLDAIPVIGPALNGQSIITYLSILLVILVQIFLFRTKQGLNIRAVGESEDAARTAGVSPETVKWFVVLFSGLICGLAGAYLSTTIVSEFTENMVQGRGFNAFTAVVFGNAHPIAVWAVTLLFGFADAVGIQIELLGTGIPPSVVKMFPFILAIVALTLSSGIQKFKRDGKSLRSLSIKTLKIKETKSEEEE